MTRGLRPTSFARAAWRNRFGSSRSCQTSTRCAAVMNSATNAQPGAGHGNGSVRTQYQPACCSPSSPVQISSSTSGPVVSTTAACPSWNSSRATAPKVATPAERQPAQTDRRGPGQAVGAPSHSAPLSGAVVGRSAEGGGRLSPELDAHVHDLVAAVELELEGVPRLSRADDLAQLRDGCDADAVHAHDDVAAERPRVTCDRHLLRRAAHSRPRSTAVTADLPDEQSAPHREAKQRGDVRQERVHLETRERMLDDAVRDQLCGDVLDRVDRDGETAVPRGPDLRRYADHLTARIQKRPAGVAVVECGVGLDHVVDRYAVRRSDPALKRADDPGGDRAV